ncbi:egl nine 2, partial [Perkinsus olseni]
TAKALLLALLWTVYARYIEEGSRGDFVRWLSPQDDDCPVGYKWLRAGMDLLVQGLARNCRCAALEGVDTVVAQSSMVAIYPAARGGNGVGSRYIRHIDNPIGDGRILTVMVYLNPEGWSLDSHGGTLRVFHAMEDGSEVATGICPSGGRLLVFLSDRVPHEVLPVTGDLHRLAITTWYMDFAARARATCEEPSLAETEKLRNEMARMGGHSVDDDVTAA